MMAWGISGMTSCALGQGTGGQTWSVILSLCCELGHARILVPEIVFVLFLFL